MAYSDAAATFAGERGFVPPVPVPGGLAGAPRAKVQHFAAHEVIFYEGDDARHVYELIDGSVMLYKLLPDGRRQVVDILGATSLFGLATGAHQGVHAETLTPASVRIVDRREADTPDVQAAIARRLRLQIELLHDHAVLLGRKSASERVASFFMRLMPDRGRESCAGPRTGCVDERLLTLAMTRQEIADYLGLTIETVSRVISDFRRRGVLVAEKQDQLRVTDICRICQMTGTH